MLSDRLRISSLDEGRYQFHFSSSRRARNRYGDRAASLLFIQSVLRHTNLPPLGERIVRENGRTVAKKLAMNGIRFPAIALFKVRELLLNDLAEGQWIRDEPEYLLCSSGSGHLDIAVIQHSTEDGLREADSLYLAQYDVEGGSPNEACLTKDTLRRNAELRREKEDETIGESPQ
jgi:hypothetical protein